jgi:high-affinity iron transporter
MALKRRPWLLGCLLLSAAAGAACSPSSDLPPGVEARLASPAARARGRQAYLEHCALCHGERGDGQGPRRSAFSEPPRDFTNLAWRRSTSPRRVYTAIRNGLHGTPMPAWAGLGDDTLGDLTAYVLSLGEPGGPPR